MPCSDKIPSTCDKASGAALRELDEWIDRLMDANFVADVLGR